MAMTVQNDSVALGQAGRRARAPPAAGSAQAGSQRRRRRGAAVRPRPDGPRPCPSMRRTRGRQAGVAERRPRRPRLRRPATRARAACGVGQRRAGRRLVGGKLPDAYPADGGAASNADGFGGGDRQPAALAVALAVLRGCRRSVPHGPRPRRWPCAAGRLAHHFSPSRVTGVTIDVFCVLYIPVFLPGAKGVVYHSIHYNTQRALQRAEEGP